MTDHALERVEVALERIADALEAQAAPQEDKAEALFAKIEEALGDPVPGMTPKQWASRLRRVKKIIRAVRKVV